MSILKLKYKAHKLINLLFYGVVFVIGFLIGIGAKNIKIEDILSKVLMINNVYAEESLFNVNYITSTYRTTYNGSNLLTKTCYDEDYCIIDINKTSNNSYYYLGTIGFNYNNSYYSFENGEQYKIDITLYGSNDYVVPTNIQFVGTNGTFSSRYSITDYTYYIDENDNKIYHYSIYYNSTSNWDTNSIIFFFNYRNNQKMESVGLKKEIKITNVSNTYMDIYYLDDEYNILNKTKCYDLTENYCNLNLNSNKGRYIQVDYHLKDLLGYYLDYVPPENWQFTTKIKGVKSNTNLLQFIQHYYFNGSTTNAANDMYIAPKTTKFNVGDLYTYTFSFTTIDDEYEDIRVYDVSVYYDVKNEQLSTIGVPYNLGIQVLSSGTIPDDSNDSTTNIDQNQAIIDQNQTIIDQNNQTNNKLDDLNSSINDSNTTGATNDATNFFNDFKSDDFGLSSIITAPLNLIKSCTSATCTPLTIPLPYVNKNLTLPCMSEIYSNYFGAFYTIYQMITFGIISYWVCVRIFNLVKDFKNPEHDEIEVLDL